MNNFKENDDSVFDLNDKLSPTCLEKEHKIIQESFNQLPENSYAKGLNRYRRYSRAESILIGV